MVLQLFAEDLWIAEGPIVTNLAFDFPTRMIVVRLSDGALFIWSPIALSQELRSAVDGLGPVRHVVAPNTLHHLFLEAWHRAYPEATLHAVPELRAKRSELEWGDDLGDRPTAAWSNDIDQVVIRENRITTEVVFFHRRSRTAIFTDMIQQFDAGWFKGWRGLVAKLDLMTAPAPTVPRKYRMAFRDRDMARQALQQILAWPTEGLLAAHARPIRHGGRDVIARAFDWLLPA
ncbi:DUF4336 domain-containing protein [Novosphingobium sp. JCM 18896]|uniref:DUF4336 domain-containing protein n=1 Tax=Novosphingobium sp. JCM 18896 TaxID=2989731 RepID=UPI00222371DC|nr:DUF4336 domain-containing protein [Novosphingobium sp. JCM 18896]MCW1431826.1 DUF4336 domain-containing protein [Novosphingobium sp. JCM 18896]